MILVHVDEDINAPPQAAPKNGDASTGRAQRRRPSGISSGWVVMRSLNQVHVSEDLKVAKGKDTLIHVFRFLGTATQIAPRKPQSEIAGFANEFQVLFLENRSTRAGEGKGADTEVSECM